MWRDVIAGLVVEPRFNPPATPAQLAQAEAALGVAVPDDLSRLLLETNGVSDGHGLGIVWPVDHIVQTNQTFRTTAEFADLYMPFDALLFFADAGNGDQFAYSVTGRAIRRHDIYVWDHEDDSRRWVAPSLPRYLDWWLSGKIRL